MLAFLGISSEEELFDAIPESIRIGEPLPVGDGMTEHEVAALFEEYGARNNPAGRPVSFLGGGVYDHAIPSVVNHLSMRSEFYTAYTPYQPEVSQGTLQSIFEFQTMIGRLTGMEVANASMYDGATALAEAALMALKKTGRQAICYPENLNPRFLRVLEAYLYGNGTRLVAVPFDDSGQIDAAALEAALDEEVAGVIVQTPNYFGVLEQPWRFTEAIRNNKSLMIAAVDPVSLALLRPPGSYGADIVVGEGQSLGNPVNFGGPLLGFMACSQKLIRNMPGRIVSRTTDIEGRDAYVLVLQTREQHIRREKATSNICTNEGLLALRAAVYLSALGERGLRELATVCYEKNHELARRIGSLPGYRLKFSAPFFREFAIECPVNAETVLARAREEGILAGIPLGRYFDGWGERCLLVSATEKRTGEEMERLVAVLSTASEGV